MAHFKELHVLKWGGKIAELPKYWRLTLGSTQQIEHKFMGGSPFSKVAWPLLKLTHCGRVTQICVF